MRQNGPIWPAVHGPAPRLTTCPTFLPNLLLHPALLHLLDQHISPYAAGPSTRMLGCLREGRGRLTSLRLLRRATSPFRPRSSSNCARTFSQGDGSNLRLPASTFSPINLCTASSAESGPLIHSAVADTHKSVPTICVAQRTWHQGCLSHRRRLSLLPSCRRAPRCARYVGPSSRACESLSSLVSLPFSELE
jgi:hypothetical protein